jgi:hypothetical protein
MNRQDALQRQINRLDRNLDRLQQTSNRLTHIRLLVALGGVTITAVLFTIPDLRVLAWLSLAVFIGGFSWVVTLHRRVTDNIAQHTAWRTIKQGHLARLALDMRYIPTPPRANAMQHPLATDLDLQNLHRVLNTAVSGGGSKRLQDWLLPTELDYEATTARQQRVRELMNKPLFRDKLTLVAVIAAEDIRESGEGQTLLDWLESDPPQTNVRRWLLGLGLLSATNLTLLGLVATGILSDAPLLLTLPAYAILFVTQFRFIQNTFEEALTVEGALRRIDAVMRYLERDRYGAMPAVRDLAAPIIEQKPSRVLRRATLVISGASLRANPIFWLLVNMFIPWDFFFADRLERLKQNLTDELPQWLEVWHDLEALSSLANFAYLNPAYTFPALEQGEGVVFDAQQIGHPLIPQDMRVRNDFAFNNLGDVVIITGSNMSGKSSFLRTLGVNLVLAYAGGTVCADGLNITLFRLYTSMRVTDSLDNGISFFYAEVKRLKEVLDAINAHTEPPVFYLIDEIFRGTNNRERLVGSQAYIRALVGSNSVGLIATHDLELASLVNESDHIRNAHFREDVAEGRMVFDYVLRDGPSPTTNALRIMALEGLPVQTEAQQAP